MRKLGVALLAGSMIAIPYAALSQESAAPSPDEFVCALTGECGDEAAPDPAATEPTDSDPRLSATRGFQLSREPAQPAPKAAPTTRNRPQQQQQTATTRRNRPVQQQAGRVDLRLGFATGSATLSAADLARVQAFAEALKRPQLTNVRVRIEGHTDSSGGRAMNVALSQRRAQAVADFLIGQGIAAERLEVRGYGYDRPLPGRRASDGNNRRVEAVRIS